MPRFSCKSPTVSAPFYNSEEEEQTLKKEEAQRAIKKKYLQLPTYWMIGSIIEKAALQLEIWLYREMHPCI